MSEIALHVVIHGRVQGVGYRAWTEYKAKQRGLSGWVRNRRDGSVEAVFAGPAAVVAEMVENCRRGPRNSAVEHIEQRDAAAEERPQTGSGFETRPTA